MHFFFQYLKPQLFIEVESFQASWNKTEMNDSVPDPVRILFLVFILFKTLENEVLTHLPFRSSVVLAMEKRALTLCRFMFSL